MIRSPQRGFTYLSLMILVTIIGLVAAAGLKMGSLFQRAAQEEELLEIGAQFSEALRSYAAATPPGKPQQPPTLQDLLRDPRFPNVRRHLRKIFVDPVTGKPEWGVIYLGDKVGVVAVHSLSDRKPLKIANFDLRFSNLENRERISDWKFVMAGGQGSVGGIITPPNSMTGNDTPGAPSLFAPGPGGAGAGGKPGAVQGSAGAKDAGQPPAGPVPVPVEAEPVEEALREESPAPPPPEEEDKKEEDKEKEEDKGAEGREEGREEVRAEEKDGRARDDDTTVQPATPVLPPPVSRRR
ncbi:type II secretion system protein [Massilia sp. PAMC28688]|uniref:type II secretion system protein n=1 Tax=Massilia sp. PAMC28688 TaxID=2861283 RepID=UPI001E62E105|nr:type II secretion system protein [Massilia sp. PAMC28688]